MYIPASWNGWKEKVKVSKAEEKVFYSFVSTAGCCLSPFSIFFSVNVPEFTTKLMIFLFTNEVF